MARPSEKLGNHGDDPPAILFDSLRLDLLGGVSLSVPYAVELEIAPEPSAAKLGRKLLAGLGGGNDFALGGASFGKAIQGTGMKADDHSMVGGFIFSS
jgi:hypothetical protein